MKLQLRQPFSLEIPLQDGSEKVITGTIRELKKSEKKQVLKTFDELKILEKSLKRDTKQLNKLKNKDISEFNADLTDAHYDNIDLLETSIEEITNKIDELDPIETTLRERFSLTIESDEKEYLQQICEDFSYQKVLETIERDITEKKPKE